MRILERHLMQIGKKVAEAVARMKDPIVIEAHLAQALADALDAAEAEIKGR